jgi:hypothetical protein
MQNKHIIAAQMPWTFSPFLPRFSELRTITEATICAANSRIMMRKYQPARKITEGHNKSYVECVEIFQLMVPKLRGSYEVAIAFARIHNLWGID